MGTLPDWMIEQLVTHHETSWAPRGRLRPVEIPDPGPLVDPYDPELLGPASLDMRLGRVFESGEPMEVNYVRAGIATGAKPAQRRTPSGNWRVDVPAPWAAPPDVGLEVLLRPGQTLICVSAEYYRLPPDVEGELYTKSSAARAGINHSTASMIHPGFHGTIAFELVNLGKIDRPVRSGARLVQIKFTKMLAAARVPYFDQRGAKYKGQTDRVESADTEGKT